MTIKKDNTFGFNTYDLAFEYKGYNIEAHVSEGGHNTNIVNLSINGDTYNMKERKWSGRGKRSNLYYDLMIELQPIIFEYVYNYKYSNK